MRLSNATRRATPPGRHASSREKERHLHELQSNLAGLQHFSAVEKIFGSQGLKGRSVAAELNEKDAIERLTAYSKTS